jgi:hypothetical protein
MTKNNNDQPTQFSSNPFIASDQQSELELNRWGLDEFEDLWDRREVMMRARSRMSEMRIASIQKGEELVITEAEEQKIYDEVKAQYKEYLAYRAIKKELINKKTEKKINKPNDREMSFQEMRELLGIEKRKEADGNEATESFAGDITEHPEYVKGYEKRMQNEKEWEERNKSPYIQGFIAASKDLAHRDTLAIEKEMTANGYETYDDKVEKLQREVRALDERLRKLEQYTQE